MKTLQNGVLRFMRYNDEDAWEWMFRDSRDKSVTFFQEANIVTGPNLVYRASANGTLTPLKSTIRKNGSCLANVANNFPGQRKISVHEFLDQDYLGWDYVNDVPVMHY